MHLEWNFFLEKSLNDEIDKLSRQNETQKHEILHLESATGSLKKQITGKNQNTVRLSKDKTDQKNKNQEKLMKKPAGIFTTLILLFYFTIYSIIDFFIFYLP